MRTGQWPYKLSGWLEVLHYWSHTQRHSFYPSLHTEKANGGKWKTCLTQRTINIAHMHICTHSQGTHKNHNQNATAISNMEYEHMASTTKREPTKTITRMLQPSRTWNMSAWRAPQKIQTSFSCARQRIGHQSHKQRTTLKPVIDPFAVITAINDNDHKFNSRQHSNHNMVQELQM